ncbi:MAG: hypothetical protein V1861_06755 [Candidatus Micrarchaeota archaeon]
MDIPKCPRCGKSVDSSNFYIHSMTLKCSECGYSGSPRASGASFYDKMKVDKSSPHDPFSEELSLQTISSRLALMGLFSAFVFMWFPEMKTLAVVSFSAFLLFSSMFGFLRLRQR